MSFLTKVSAWAILYMFQHKHYSLRAISEFVHQSSLSSTTNATC